MVRANTENQESYPSVQKFFTDGYGKGLCAALLRSMERHFNPDTFCEGDVDDVWHLSTLLKCVLKDEYGIDLIVR